MTPHNGPNSLNCVQEGVNEHNTQPHFVDPACYTRMEHKARWYFTELHALAKKETFLIQLSQAYHQWSQDSSNKQNTKLSLIEQQMQSGDGFDSLSFLQKLSVDRQLKAYLDKSLSYIFMRDLGKSIHNKQTAKQIDDISQQIQNWVRKNERQGASNLVDNSLIDRKAKEYQLEDTIDWLKSKLQLLEQKLPASLDKTNGLRKLVKVIAGVVLHQLIDLPKNTSKADRTASLNVAIRLGYCYGLTYPLIDDIQDACTFLNDQEKEDFNQAIKQSLLNGKVVEFPKFTERNTRTMLFVYEELKAAFENIKQYQSSANASHFFEQAYVFFEAQNVDRKKSLKDTQYSDEDLFLPVILKSAGSRLLARDIVQNARDEHFDHRTFCFGIYNQFNDDIKDLFNDIKEDNLTAYNHYFVHCTSDNKGNTQGNTKSNVNPYRIYWAVVFYLITVVYKNDPKIKQLFLERSINAHKSLKTSVGDIRYKALEASLLNTGNEAFDAMISGLVNAPNQVAWFDKLISREVSQYFEHQRQQQRDFKHYYESAQAYVDKHLSIDDHKRMDNTHLVDAANYALQVGGKRLRPVLAYITLCHRYGFTAQQTVPVLQLLEYMHTASLVFDDKPSQDNAPLRRGQPALHVHCKSEAQAELAGVYLIMKAVEVQSTIKDVAATQVLASIEYAANTTQAICEGQLLDLQSHSAHTSIKELERICFLKTSLAIEAAILIPAILGGENDIEKGHLKRYAKYLGLVFQLKDDLLDAQGDALQLGKPTQQDSYAQKASFVTLLGIDGAKDKLSEYRQLANESLRNLSSKTDFYQQLLDFVIHRAS